MWEPERIVRDPEAVNDDIEIAVFLGSDTNFTAKLSDLLGSKQPEYASYERRLHSFATCTSDTICQKKEELAAAGFFFLGNFFRSDQTMCFYCGEWLKDWERTDDPVEEHVKWFPQCKFIKKVIAKKRLEKENDLYAER